MEKAMKVPVANGMDTANSKPNTTTINNTEIKPMETLTIMVTIKLKYKSNT
jgi:hypothetical protein